MSMHDDISWQVLRRIVQDWAGSSAELAEVKPLEGGSIATTLLLATAGGDRAVLKISPHRVDRSYLDEEMQLSVLRDAGLPVPRVYQCSLGTLDAPYSFILLEFLPGMNLSQARQACSAEEFDRLQEHLAEIVASMHSRTAERYRRITSDESLSHAVWPEFYRGLYNTIWRETEKSGLIPVKCRKQINKVHDRLERLISHSDCPRLLHGDLWASNILAAADDSGRWRVTGILDPWSKFGHTEAELAYLELFHTVTPAFMKVYQASHRISPDYYRIRRPIYQLYPMINHVHLFGQEYLKQLIAMVERTTSLV